MFHNGLIMAMAWIKWHFSETQSHERQEETSKTEEKTLMPAVSIFIALKNGNKDINDFLFLSSDSWSCCFKRNFYNQVPIDV